MFIARWIIDVRFGKKDEFERKIKEWDREVGEKVGITSSQQRIRTGSIGAMESRYEFDLEVESLQALQEKWDAMVEYEAHSKFGDEMEPLVVPGSSHWEIFRPVDLRD